MNLFAQMKHMALLNLYVFVFTIVYLANVLMFQNFSLS